ncbi:MAG: hypothetical protein HZA32_20400 [Opitutae bacterium]|nr:hypothetical protein [Opitutae bacterium]
MLTPQNNALRQAINLDGIWELSLDGASAGTTTFVRDRFVAVPGSLEELYCESWWTGGERDVCYRTFFELPSAPLERTWSVWFGAANYRAEVWVNGIKLGEHATGYTPFEFPLPASIGAGERVEMRVRVSQKLSADTIPMGNLRNSGGAGQFAGQYPDVPFDFFPFVGIHRSVQLVGVSSRAVLSSARLEPTVSVGTTGLLNVRGNVSGESTRVECVIPELAWCESAIVSNGQFQVQATFPSVERWDVNRPRLYIVRFTVFDLTNGAVDTYVRKIGFREVRVVGAELHLNGRAVRLNGFGRHEDFAVLGKSYNTAVAIRDFALMRWTGANSFRTSHYPYAEETLDLADELGVLVIAETPAVSINFEHTTEQTLGTHLRCVEELIARDHHHPCVVLWSVANESLSTHPRARPYFERVTKRARELDCTRPLIGVTCHGAADTTLDLYDMIGMNLYPGWYEYPGQLDVAEREFVRIMDEVHAVFPGPIMITETGADAIAGFHSLPARQWSEEYQAELIERLLKRGRSLPYLVGEHIWNFADFATAQNFPRALGNRKGVFTRDRQPKFAAHWLRRWWHEQS